MKRAINLLVIVGLTVFFAACSGGGDNTPDVETGPLSVTLWAEPAIGSSPLRVTFTAYVSGGLGPYYYAWDYQADDRDNNGELEESDLVFDEYRHNEFQRTVSVQHDYNLIASDPGGTQYQAVLRVTDSEKTVFVTEPLVINVLADGGITFDPDRTWAWSDERRDDGSYVFRTGEPVFFRAKPVGGVAPFEYRWDFNNDGIVDSTVEQPEFTYTYNEPGAMPVTAVVTIVDDNGEEVSYEFLLLIDGPADSVPPAPAFDIILNTNPPAVDNSIMLLFNDSVENVNRSPDARILPIEPELDLSIVVNPLPGQGGIPPYEYYWDFENDGNIDSQFPSPTIPYYNTALKITENPYLSLETKKEYRLRCLVIDATGQVQEEFRDIVVERRGENINALQTIMDYGIANGSGTAFNDDPPKPYGMVNGHSSVTNALFEFENSGSTGLFQWQMDVDWDGDPDNFDPEFPLIDQDGDPLTDDSLPDWSAPYNTGNKISHNVMFGPYLDHDEDPLTPNIAQFAAVGYAPVAVRIRSIASAGSTDAVDTRIYSVPVSLVQRSEISVEGTPINERTDHVMGAAWSIGNGLNGAYLERRHVTIAGGAQGETVLRDVERLLQTFEEPLEAGSIPPPLVTAYITGLSQMNARREGAALYAFDPAGGSVFTVFGGNNPVDGLLASEEASQPADGTASSPWDILGIEVLGYYPIADMLSEEILFADGTTSITIPGGLGLYDFLFTGGRVGGEEGSEVGNVNRKMISFSFRRPIGVPPYVEITGRPMPTPRYDGAAVFDGQKFYVIGGRVASGESVGTMEAFNFNTGHWETELLPPLKYPRSGHVAEIVDGKIYVLGGSFYPGDEQARQLVLTAEVYNPATGVWSETLPLDFVQASENGTSVVMPGPSGVTQAGAVSKNTIWYFGGRGGNDAEKRNLTEFIYSNINLPDGYFGN